MKAAVSRDIKSPLLIEDVTLAPPGPGEVQVGIRAVAICHSDVIFIDGGWAVNMPAVFGHEAAGEVIALGEGVEGFAEGDRVVVTLIRGCGTCKCCLSTNRTYCTTEFALSQQSPLTDASGVPVTQGVSTGAFAEQVTVHASQIAKLTGDIGWDAASLLACGVITGYGAVTNAAKMPAGADVVVIGAGGVGLNAVQGAALNGAGRVIVVDISEEKLEIAREFGATDVVDGRQENLPRVIRRMTGGGADFVFVTVGNTKVMDGAYSMIAVGGAVVLVGMPPSGQMSTIDPLLVADMGQRIIGSKMGQSVISRDIPALEQSYYDGKLKLDELITGHFAFEDINEAVDLTRQSKGVRNVVLL
ncbi:MAG: zinc-binding dehydrogenase [Pseudomonadota bacterium]